MKKILNALQPLFRRLGREKSHQLTLWALKVLSYKMPHPPELPLLRQKIWGRDFLSPLGLAAGFDRNGEAIGGYFHLGFGFAELGTVTPQRQEDESENDGIKAVCRRLGAFRLANEHHWGLIGINIGANKGSEDTGEDVHLGIAHVGAMADYVVFNFEILKDALLDEVLTIAMQEREKIHERLPPLFIKISDALNRQEIAALCTTLRSHGVNGVIVAADMIADFYDELKDEIPIIGCGGVRDAQSAYERIKAGASLLQIYDGFFTEGPAIAHNIHEGLAALLQQDGFQSLTDAVGSGAATKEPTA